MKPQIRKAFYPYPDSSVISLMGEAGFLRERDIRQADVVVFVGGVDISPSLYHSQTSLRTGYTNHMRDCLEVSAFNSAVELGVPLIGICRGAQLITALLGGTLYQHVDGHGYGDHPLSGLGIKGLLATTCHHQMCDLTNVPHTLIGWTENLSLIYDKEGISVAPPQVDPEIWTCRDIRALCYQGHPEWDSHDYRKHFLDMVEEFV